jgi:hypothetical protein
VGRGQANQGSQPHDHIPRCHLNLHKPHTRYSNGWRHDAFQGVNPP